MNLYAVGKTLVKTALHPLYRFEVLGTEHFPKEGGVLLCSNHINALDPPVVGMTAPRTVHFMAKEELFKLPVLGPILPKVNAFPVKRGMSDREALRTALKVLKSGEVVGLFPEGTRSTDGVLKKGLSGAGFFALRGNADVVPCAIIGPYKMFRKVRVVYGKPILMDPYRERRASAEEVTEVIMSSIQEILDEYSKNK
ncbi:acyl-phosphate glycerol 3-phosphate acyltransferase [Planococcus glaciei]|uniref:Lysophospholipid acyltransferase family protein n=1 Tax=Planococcus liqunii TaxID=3058394 RepID=A0ABT8MLS8_9BACL|nr:MULTISPECIES: lysophospholipid acyltransferase family protein [Planococcus]ETP70680.1 1-acyl-sn-glycerol-3-phosphate acyltransferase [Planococcus glaciei CHR43]KOF11243.1 acyl-phosphate glycerol 3-phosphate acyltransferase [Planococcus glaciei]MBX0313888.1 1-acyl-sn-glycerol-3-phosphate acyltransferase [Planococcus glaciei]MDN7225826.1 lysophospholipid acyltransferase family protein [Planococcus sp. N064]WKA49620.1 lysophospholipid acyltransferase family protein [Planococcus sp. N056]